MAENPRIVPEIDEPALEVWETLQKRQLKLTLRTEMNHFEEQERELPWEVKLEETWASMRTRLELQLKDNSLDHEKKA